MREITIFLICALCVATAAAQEEPLDELAEEEVRRYTVEIIIFSYEENVSVGTEVFVRDDPPIEEELFNEDEALVDADEADIAADAATSDDEGSVTPIRELDLVLLTEEEFTLDKVARQFELLDVYETIMHFGWVQPTYPQEETPPIELRILGDPPEGLEGSFTLYLSRYLHLVVDLALDAPESLNESIVADEPYYSDDPTYSFGDARVRNDNVFDPKPQPVRFRIQENRIVKNGELRYFDHPKFGVLAKITRIEEEDAESDDLSEPLLSSAR